jgi:hypothetical protein
MDQMLSDIKVYHRAIGGGLQQSRKLPPLPQHYLYLGMA